MARSCTAKIRGPISVSSLDPAIAAAGCVPLGLDPLTILESTTDSVFVVDRDWRIVYLNQRAAAQIGGGRDLRGANFWEAFPETVGREFEVAYRAAMKDGVATEVEGYYSPLNTWFAANAFPLPDGLAVFFRDTSERKRSEAALRASEERFRSLFETLTQGVLFLNRHCVVTGANPAAERILGRAFDEVCGRAANDPRWQMTDEEGRPFPSERHPANVALSTGRIVRGSVMSVFNPKLNERRWLLGDAIPQFSPDGVTPDALFVLFSDITEQRNAEMALKASQGHLARAQRLAAVGSAEVSFVTTEWKWSDELYRIYGYDKGTVPPSLQLLLEIVHPDDRGTLAAGIEGARHGITPEPLEYRIIRPNGQVRIIYREAELIRDGRGTVVGLIATKRDVTELRAAERQKEELRMQLLHAQRLDAIGTLAGGIAHDLNNTLIPVVALSKHMLTKAPEGSHEQECLNLIHRGGASARDLVRRILTFARRYKAEQKWIDLRDFVRSALPLLRSALPATIVLTEKLEAAPPIWADEGQLSQALLNLVTNAAQAIGESPGKITIEVTPGSDAPTVRLSVVDTGSGMDDVTRERIFEPFFTTKALDEGTGLGLSVVHGIVTGHGAMITVDSQPGQGARFDIHFPIPDRTSTVEGGSS